MSELVRCNTCVGDQRINCDQAFAVAKVAISNIQENATDDEPRIRCSFSTNEIDGVTLDEDDARYELLHDLVKIGCDNTVVHLRNNIRSI